MGGKLKLIYFFCIIFFLTYNKIYPNRIEEVSKIETSSISFMQNDSIFKKKYENLLKKNKEKKYIETLKEAFLFYDNIKNKDSLNLVVILIADIYDKTNNHKKALEYYKKSLSLLTKDKTEVNDSKLFLNRHYAKTLLSIGGQYQKLFIKDSAKYYYSKLEKIPSLNKDILNLKAVSFGNLSGIYAQDSLFDKAKEYANKAIIIHKDRNDKVNQASAINNLANIYLGLEDFNKAKKLYLEGIELIKNDNSANAVRFKASLYYNLAWAMRNLKDYKAYDFQELSYEMEDGMRDKEIRTMIETVTAKNNVRNVKKEEENKRLKAQRTFWVFGIGGLIVIISLLYWVNFYKLKQKNLGLELSQTQLIQNQKIEKIRSDSQTRILNATIDGKESERKQIAETLHDSVSALLSSANLHLQATKSQFNGKTPIEIDKTREIITEASQKIRDLSHTLVSSVLLKFGLEFAIKDMADKYSNSQIEFETNIGDIKRFNQNFEIKLYNIIQEFVNNILKHSKAKKAIIELKEEKDRLYLKISDDGIGFDKTKITDKDGLGINQIDARIQMMKGDFLIDSAKNKGTIIYVELPILEKGETNLV